MVEELTVEMANPPVKKPFWRTKGGIIFILLCLLCAIGGGALWWLSAGRITSVAATIDTLVYPVEPQYAAQLKNIYVNEGELVNDGQALGSVEETISRGSGAQAEAETAAPMSDIAYRLLTAQRAEKEMAVKVSQARDEEDRMQKAYQDAVAAHVREQLRLRAININDRARYEQARGMENAAKGRMNAARDAFEQTSKSRAVMEVELNKIRAELQRNRMRGAIPQPAAAAAQPELATIDLVSPVQGKVLRICANAGQMLQAGEPVFYVLPRGNTFAKDSWIDAWFPLETYKQLKTGQKVNVRFPDRDLDTTGKIIAISDEAQQMKHNANDGHMKSIASYDKNKYNTVNYLLARVALDDPAEMMSFQPGTKAICEVQTRHLISEDLF